MASQYSPPAIGITTNPTLYTAVIGPSQASVYRNGAQYAWTGKTRYPGPNGLLLGGSSNEFSNCMVSEVIVYNRAVSTDERIAVETYLRNKYTLVFW